MAASRERRAEREIAAYIERHGGQLTDDMEREIMRHLNGQSQRHRPLTPKRSRGAATAPVIPDAMPASRSGISHRDPGRLDCASIPG